MMRSISVVVLSLISILLIQSTHAGEPCTVEMMRAMIEEGLSNDQIQSICDRARLLQGTDAKAEEDIYTKAQRLYENQQFDDMVTLLGTYCQEHHYDMKANILLANAYMEQVEQLKASDDKEYKELVMKAYYIGRRFVTGDPENPDALYVAGRSFVLNNRPERGLKYIKKAISVSNKGICEYYLALGDANIAAGRNDVSRDGTTSRKNESKEAYQRAIELAKIDWLKEKAQKKLDAID